MFGKKLPILGILLIAMLTIGGVSAAVVSYLSNTVTKPVSVASPIDLSGTFTYQTIQYAAPTFTPPNINGVIGAGEWDGAFSIPVASNMGTVKVLATTDYLYMLFDVEDPTDNRVESGYGNDKIGVNINPDGGPYGLPCKIIFQTGTDPAAWSAPSCGDTDDYKTDWKINGVQQVLPCDLVTKTLYSETTRISEWQIPLATINPSLGYNLDLGGACDNLGNTGYSYRYPPGLDWGNPGTYVHYTIGTPVTVTETFDGTQFSEQLYGGSEFSMSFEAKNLANNGIDTTIGIVMDCPGDWTWTETLPKEIMSVTTNGYISGYSGQYFVVAHNLDGIGPGQTAEWGVQIKLAPNAGLGVYTIKAVVVWTNSLSGLSPNEVAWIVVSALQ